MDNQTRYRFLENKKCDKILQLKELSERGLWDKMLIAQTQVKARSTLRMVSNLRWFLAACLLMTIGDSVFLVSSQPQGYVFTGLCIIMGVLATMAAALYILSRQIARLQEHNAGLSAQLAAAHTENRNKSQFLANVSHELRTPLNAIIGFSEFIRSECSGAIGNKVYAEYIHDIFNSGVHLLSLVNDILDYSKAAADKLELEIDTVDVRNTVLNSIRLVSPRARDAQVQILEKISAGEFIVKTDARKLKQIMLNLLSNAVKFTPAGGTVTVTMWPIADAGLSIEVRDTGVGISQEDIPRAMAPFGQVESALSHKYEGTGLGLPLSKKFVEIMNGTFDMKSEVGKGTAIIITLPKEVLTGALPVTPSLSA